MQSSSLRMSVGRSNGNTSLSIIPRRRGRTWLTGRQGLPWRGNARGLRPYFNHILTIAGLRSSIPWCGFKCASCHTGETSAGGPSRPQALTPRGRHQFEGEKKANEPYSRERTGFGCDQVSKPNPQCPAARFLTGSAFEVLHVFIPTTCTPLYLSRRVASSSLAQTRIIVVSFSVMESPCASRLRMRSVRMINSRTSFRIGSLEPSSLTD